MWQLLLQPLLEPQKGRAEGGSLRSETEQGRETLADRLMNYEGRARAPVPGRPVAPVPGRPIGRARAPVPGRPVALQPGCILKTSAQPNAAIPNIVGLSPMRGPARRHAPNGTRDRPAQRRVSGHGEPYTAGMTNNARAPARS
jgi:hypothetical protein